MSSSTKSVIVSGKSEYEDYQSLSRCSTKEADSFVVSEEGNQNVFFNDFLINKLKELETLDDSGDNMISNDD